MKKYYENKGSKVEALTIKCNGEKDEKKYGEDAIPLSDCGPTEINSKSDCNNYFSITSGDRCCYFYLYNRKVSEKKICLTVDNIEYKYISKTIDALKDDLKDG